MRLLPVKRMQDFFHPLWHFHAITDPGVALASKAKHSQGEHWQNTQAVAATPKICKGGWQGRAAREDGSARRLTIGRWLMPENSEAT